VSFSQLRRFFEHLANRSIRLRAFEPRAPPSALSDKGLPSSRLAKMPAIANANLHPAGIKENALKIVFSSSAYRPASDLFAFLNLSDPPLATASAAAASLKRKRAVP
jgi:hypothetical protein